MSEKLLAGKVPKTCPVVDSDETNGLTVGVPWLLVEVAESGF